MKSKKMIWAVNPFRDDKKTQTKARAFVSTLAKKAKLSVQPTFVSDPAEIRITVETGSLDKRRIVDFAQQKLRAALPTPWRSAAQVLFQEELSLSASAGAMCRSARKERAELIVTATRAKGGVGLYWVGSFTQALVSHSSVPVLSVNPARYRASPIRRILFATDFSAASRKALQRLCPLARALKAEIVICHIFAYPAYWMYDATIFQPAALSLADSEFMKQTRAELEAKCERMATEVRRHGVEAVGVVRESVSHSIANGILREALKCRASMIALASESGKFTSTVLGTTTQHLMRDSALPVWTYRPHGGA